MKYVPVVALAVFALLLAGCGKSEPDLEDGLVTRWHANGQKKEEGTWKDGKMDGLQTYWHENGQKWAELTLRDGQVISEKWWNSKGEEVETPIDALK